MPITPTTTATITLNNVATTLGNATKNMNALRGFGGSTPATSGSTISLSQCQTIQQGVGYYNAWFKATSVTNQGTWVSTAITNNSSMTYAVWVVSTQINAAWRNVVNVNTSTADGSRRPSVWIYANDTGFHIRHDTSSTTNEGLNISTTRITMNGTSKFHLVVTLSGTTMKTYINGALSDTTTLVGIPTNAPTTDVVASPGAGVAGVGDYALNYLWFFPYPMTATQVSTYYNSLVGIIGSPSFASGAPSSFVYGSSTSSSITFSWTAGSGALSYSVSSSPAGATNPQTTSTTSITFTGLSGGTSYTFTVTSYNGAIAGSAATTGSYSTTSSSLYTMTLPFTFTNMGATGVTGPTAITYGTNNPGYNTPNAMTLGTGTRAGMQLWKVPTTKTWTIKAAGAGMTHPVSGACNGMVCQANYNLTAGQVIVILVGQQGLATGFNGYGGCGGTFVVDSATNTPIIVAGGAGGGGNDANSGTAPISPSGSASPAGGVGGTAGNGGQGCPGVAPTSNRGEAGGGGFNTGAYPTGGDGGPPTVGNPSGKLGGKSFLNGGGAATLVTGGFGGGGDSKRNVPTNSGGVGGGGGGGYSGGGGGSTNSAGAPGGNGGSYGTTSYSGTTLTPVGTNTGMGYVTVQ